MLTTLLLVALPMAESFCMSAGVWQYQSSVQFCQLLPNHQDCCATSGSLFGAQPVWEIVHLAAALRSGCSLRWCLDGNCYRPRGMCKSQPMQ